MKLKAEKITEKQARDISKEEINEKFFYKYYRGSTITALYF